MDTGLIFGGADEAEKSVAWLHRHCTLDERTHPHPSNVCVSLRQKHIALFRGFCACISRLRTFSLTLSRGIDEGAVEQHRGFRGVVQVLERQERRVDGGVIEGDGPVQHAGQPLDFGPLGIGLGSVAQPLVDDSSRP